MRVPVAILTLLGVVAAPVSAQNVCEAVFAPPPVGSWVEYDFQGQGQAGRSRLSVVGQETRDGTSYTWYEMNFDAAGQSMILKMLADGGFYAAMAEKKIEEIVIKAAGQPAMKFSGPMMERVRSQMNVGSDPASQFGQGCENAERIGVESITVPAGTFDAVHYRLATGTNPGDAWVVEGMPFGMVRWVGDKGEGVVLVGTGDGARSAITETPIEMSGG
jgi:hypothetical protein